MLSDFVQKAIFIFVFCIGAAAQAQSPVAIALHGGAGTITRAKITAEQDAAYRLIMDEVVTFGYQRLNAGVSGNQVVVEVLQKLEDSPLFNAGVGAVMTWDGVHELDAAIMDGATRQAGAVAGVRHIRSPIEAAQKVMLHSPHVMLTGVGAEEFAQQQGLELIDNSVFTTERRQKALEQYKEHQSLISLNDAQDTTYQDYKFGTVGVAVRDSRGDLSAGTSTGGMTGKRWGRVGDSPIIGAGTFADNASCAVSATGHGEYFIRYQVASDICARMKYLGISLQQAANVVVNQVLRDADGEGGIVAVDSEGNVALVFNTEGMYRASIDTAGQKTVAIYRDE